jgi:pectate lyase
MNIKYVLLLSISFFALPGFFFHNSNNSKNSVAQETFDLLKISGDSGELLEGSYSAQSACALDNQGTQSRSRIHQGGFGTESQCGLNGEIIKVTNLNDSGSGSLREAIEATGPRTIVFEVSGAIRLQSSLKVLSPFVTIAGHTAPAPGISLYHAQFRIETHDVCVQHLRIRLGDQKADLTSYSLEEAQNADAIAVRGRTDPAGTYNVILDNLSVSWSIDEAISVFYDVENLTIRDSIIGEPLRYNAHGRNHAYCLFIKDQAKRVSLIGNIFTQCQRRSPRMNGGTLQYVNNLVYNPGEYAIHAHDDEIDVTMIGNALEFPSDASNRWEGGDGPSEFFTSRTSSAKVFSMENRTELDKLITGNYSDGNPVNDQSRPSVWHGSVLALTPESMRSSITKVAGAFPRHRDSVDSRLIADINNKRGTYTDSQSDVGGYPKLKESYRTLNIPKNPQSDDNNNGISNLAEWLKEFLNTIE